MEIAYFRSDNLTLLLDLNFDSTPVSDIDIVKPRLLKFAFVPLLSHAAWPVGVGIDLCFPREASPLSSSMCTVLLKFINRLETISTAITVTPKVS